MNAIFTALSATFTAQDALREQIRTHRDAANVAIRQAQRLLSEVHTSPDPLLACKAVREALQKTGPLIVAIEQTLPSEPGSFYRYCELWHNQLQNCATVAVTVTFVERDTLASMEEVTSMMGANVTMPVEDYLMGVCGCMPELSRLSMQRVIVGDFEMSKRCARFANGVVEGFKELNLRNDFLRKRYDGIKYDVKRMEEILYDLSIRGLAKQDGDVMMEKKDVDVMTEKKDGDVMT